MVHDSACVGGPFLLKFAKSLGKKTCVRDLFGRKLYLLHIIFAISICLCMILNMKSSVLVMDIL